MKSGILLLVLAFFHLSTFAVDNSIHASASNTDGSAVFSSLLENSAVSDTYEPFLNSHYFDWGRGQNGWGYCYEWGNGYVLNSGYPVGNVYCEEVRPSYFNWGRGMDGYTYCYQYTPYGVVMNEGYPVANQYCY